MERFNTHIGMNYNPEYICSLSDEELTELIENAPEWDVDLLRDLVWRASDELREEWEKQESGTEDHDLDYFFNEAKRILFTA